MERYLFVAFHFLSALLRVAHQDRKVGVEANVVQSVEFAELAEILPALGLDGRGLLDRRHDELVPVVAVLVEVVVLLERVTRRRPTPPLGDLLERKTQVRFFFKKRQHKNFLPFSASR